MPKSDLLGKRVLITGAARGIGEKVARIAVARGALVSLLGLEPDRLCALASELGPTASWWEADVCGEGLRSAIDDAAAHMCGIDIVVANAGVLGYGTVRLVDDDSFQRVIDVNLNGVFRTLKYSTRYLENSSGHVLVVASATSFIGLAGLASYCASKAGVEMLGVTYRQEVAHLGITVGLAHLTFVDTEMLRAADSDLPAFRELRSRLPYPGNVLVDLDRAASALVAGMLRRRSRVYVPRGVALASWLKAATASPAAWPSAKRLAVELVPRLEAEFTALGRVRQLTPGAKVGAVGDQHLGSSRSSPAAPARPNVLTTANTEA
jgi:NAD(P)-dependent dehydrogenase (short-subunit alcohol dehydrogenase family)